MGSDAGRWRFKVPARVGSSPLQALKPLEHLLIWCVIQTVPFHLQFSAIGPDDVKTLLPLAIDVRSARSAETGAAVHQNTHRQIDINTHARGPFPMAAFPEYASSLLLYTNVHTVSTPAK